MLSEDIRKWHKKLLRCALCHLDLLCAITTESQGIVSHHAVQNITSFYTPIKCLHCITSHWNGPSQLVPTWKEHGQERAPRHGNKGTTQQVLQTFVLEDLLCCPFASLFWVFFLSIMNQLVCTVILLSVRRKSIFQFWRKVTSPRARGRAIDLLLASTDCLVWQWRHHKVRPHFGLGYR